MASSNPARLFWTPFTNLNLSNIPSAVRQNTIASMITQRYGFRPKDELKFLIEVRDNDGYNGPNGENWVRILRIPSLTEFFDDIGEQEDEVGSDMENISESFEAIKSPWI